MFRQAIADVQKHAGEILDEAEVVLSTCVGAESKMLSHRRFVLGVLDEASQAVEPATLIPLIKGCQAALLVGDVKQLPPTVLSRQVSRFPALYPLLREKVQHCTRLACQAWKDLLFSTARQGCCLAFCTYRSSR